MQLDVISDAICPWCYVGQRHLEQALKRRPVKNLRIRWRPFILDPTIPPEGVDRKSYYAKRFGDDQSRQDSLRNVLALGAAAGIRFAFDKIKRVPNTLNAHRLVRWCGEMDLAGDALMVLFRKYFEEGADIGEDAVLAGIADDLGLDADAIAARLATDEDIEAVLEDDRAARALGINGVPCILVDERYALMGAQDTANLVAVFDRIESRRAV